MAFYNSSDPYEEFLEIPEMFEVNLEYDNIIDNLKGLKELVKENKYEDALDIVYSCFQKYWKPELELNSQYKFLILAELAISFALSADDLKKAALLFDTMYVDKLLTIIPPHYNMHYLQAVIWVFTGRFTNVKPNLAIGDGLILQSEDQSSIYKIIAVEMYDVWPKQRLDLWNGHLKNYYEYKISALIDEFRN